MRSEPDFRGLELIMQNPKHTYIMMHLLQKQLPIASLLLCSLFLHVTGQCDSEINDLVACQNIQTEDAVAQCDTCFAASEPDFSSDSCDRVSEKYCSFKACCGACLSEVKNYWECEVDEAGLSVGCALNQCGDCSLKLRDLTDCQSRETAETVVRCTACFDKVAIDLTSDTCDAAKGKYCAFVECCDACASEVKEYWQCEIVMASSTPSCDIDKCDTGSGSPARMSAGGLAVGMLVVISMMI